MYYLTKMDLHNQQNNPNNSKNKKCRFLFKKLKMPLENNMIHLLIINLKIFSKFY